MTSLIHRILLGAAGLVCGAGLVLAAPPEKPIDSSAQTPIEIVNTLQGKFGRLKALREDFSSKAKEFTSGDGSVQSRDAAAGRQFDTLVAEFRDLITYTSPSGEFSQVAGQIVEALDRRIGRLKSLGSSQAEITKLEKQRNEFIDASQKTTRLNASLVDKLNEILAYEQLIRKGIRDSVSADDLTNIVKQMNALINQIIIDADALIKSVRPNS